MQSRATRAYKKVAATSAPPTRVLDELYVRLRRDLTDAHGACGTGDTERRCKALAHAMKIVTALEAGLDRDAAPTLCDQLASLYDFVKGRILRANLHADASAIAEAYDVIVSLHDAFAQLDSPALAA